MVTNCLLSQFAYFDAFANPQTVSQYPIITVILVPSPVPGVSEETYPCNTHYCQLPGKHLWSPWSVCSAECGRGEQTRHTLCGKLKKKQNPKSKKKKDRGKGEKLG